MPKSLSERRSLSEAWGLADLLYKLFWQAFQRLRLVYKPEDRHPVRLLFPTVAASNRLIESQATEARDAHHFVAEDHPMAVAQATPSRA
jgi:CBS-domain-containing membrane protein